MPPKINAQFGARHLPTSDIKAPMAKATIRKPETSDAAIRNADVSESDIPKADDEQWREAIGKVIAEVKGQLSLKEFADALHRNERQISRWLSGAERPQFDVIIAVATFRPRLILALAALAGDGVEVESIIRIRRRA